MELSGPFAASAVFVVLLAMLAEQRSRTRAARVGLAPRRPSGARRGLALALGLLSAVFYGYSLLAAVALLMSVPLLLAVRVRGAEQVVAPGHFAPIAAARLHEHARLARGEGSLSDATTLRGALAMLTALFVMTRMPGAYDLADDPYGFALLCALPSWLLGARLRWSRAPAERLSLLARALQGCTLRGCALRALAYVGDDGSLREPRVRVLPAARYAGLLRIDVLVDSRRDRPPFVLCALVQRGSASERSIVGSRSGVSRGRALPGGRVVLLWTVSGFDRGVAELLSTLARARRLEAAGLDPGRHEQEDEQHQRGPRQHPAATGELAGFDGRVLPLAHARHQGEHDPPDAPVHAG